MITLTISSCLGRNKRVENINECGIERLLLISAQWKRSSKREETISKVEKIFGEIILKIFPKWTQIILYNSIIVKSKFTPWYSVIKFKKN